MERGPASSSFELNVPQNNSDRVIRTKLTNSDSSVRAYISYVPAIDVNGNQTNEYLRHYLFSFDSRPYSKYVTKISGLLPNTGVNNDIMKQFAKDIWPVNFLIAGAPGTGKSFKIAEKTWNAIKHEMFFNNNPSAVVYDDIACNQYISNLASSAGITETELIESIKSERIRRVTFYEDYSYETFVGSYAPVPEVKRDIYDIDVTGGTNDLSVSGSCSGNQIVYKYISGPFIDTYIDAINNPNQIYFLVVEEINRAKAASVFGDMFQLLDRLDGESKYSITPSAFLSEYLNEKLPGTFDGTMKLPSNMYIWATMNNADQGVFPLDSAFKRRWGYMYLDVNSSFKDCEICIGKAKTIRWDIFRNALNEKILEIATEDKCIGAWYFSDEEFAQIKAYFDADDNEGLINPLTDKLLIYLLNDICRMDPKRLFIGDYTNMPHIRAGIRSGIDLDEMLGIEWKSVYASNNDWLMAANGTNDSTVENAEDQ